MRSTDLMTYWIIASFLSMLPSLGCIEVLVRAQPGTPASPMLAQPDPLWNQLFQARDGWAGGDGAYSTLLPDGRVLWLFSDSFAGRLTLRDGKWQRPGTRFLNNTAAISQLGSQTSLEYFVAKNADGQDSTWLVPADGRGWYWPVASFPTSHGVAIVLWRIEKNGEKGAFGFRLFGCDMAFIDRAEGSVGVWQPRIETIPFCQVNASDTSFLGSSATVHRGYIYLTGTRQKDPNLPVHETILARFAREHWEDFESWEFFAGESDSGPIWSRRMEAAHVICRDTATELSISHDAKRDRWIMIHQEPRLGPHVQCRVAKEITGPWSAPISIYRCPEVDLAEGVFCYASKGHPELSGDDQLLITYASNCSDFKTLIEDARIYIPRVIQLDLRLLQIDIPK